jgi:hypothetical protein
MLERHKQEKKREVETAIKKKAEKQRLSFMIHDDDEEDGDGDRDGDDDKDKDKEDDVATDAVVNNGDASNAENGAQSTAGEKRTADKTRDADSDQLKKKPKMMKNPFIDTTFLPDRDREKKEEELRKQLLAEWNAEQEKIKSECVSVLMGRRVR